VRQPQDGFCQYLPGCLTQTLFFFNVNPVPDRCPFNLDPDPQLNFNRDHRRSPLYSLFPSHGADQNLVTIRHSRKTEFLDFFFFSRDHRRSPYVYYTLPTGPTKIWSQFDISRKTNISPQFDIADQPQPPQPLAPPAPAISPSH
jgi:hypothetical protein